MKNLIKINLKILIIIILLLIIYLFGEKRTKSILWPNPKKIQFLHIPKNGGSTIRAMFAESGNLGENYKKNINCQTHFDSFPKIGEINFAIIRNPETRLQSIFAYIKERSDYNTDHLLKSYDLANFNTLHELAVAYYDKKNKYHNKARELLDWDINKFKSYNSDGCTKDKICIHWCPQYIFVYGHESNVEYLLKLETLEQDIDKLYKLKILSISNKRPRLLTKNQSLHNYKQKAFMSTISKKLVQDVYKKDFELWKKAGL
jgi:NAD-dependent dihydropyrimidine dehydrogenase PreA subunit